MRSIEDLLRTDRIVAIFRGLTMESTLAAAQGLYEAGVRWFEVTMNSADAVADIGALREKLPGDVAVGAGTVLAAGEVDQVAAAGASFVISPNVDEAVIARTRELGLASIPGTFTATEVVRAEAAGADAVKVFPVRPVGADYVRQLRGPLDSVPLLVSGGVGAELARECFDAGADCAGVGLGHFGVDVSKPIESSAVAAAGRRFLATAGVG